MNTVTVMGITVSKSTESQSFNPQTNCSYYGTLCKICTCDKCHCGTILTKDKDGYDRATKCGCMTRAYNRKLLRDEGLEGLVDRYTFDSYIVTEPWQKTVKEKAVAYLKGWNMNSFFISGQSGSGKSHICVAIVNELNNAGARIRFFKWLECSTRLKGIVNDYDRYIALMKPYIDCDLLYIDDFFKQSVTDADIRLAYEIIDARYTAGLPTVISSERSIEYIRSVKDNEGEAIAGRIFEACDYGRFCINLTGADKNQRLNRKG